VITIAAVLVCLVLGALAVFQLLLVLGAPLGRFAWGGQHRVLPVALRAGSVVSIVIYGLIAAVVLARADLVSPGVRDGVVATVAWVVVAYFFLGIGMNLASRSRSERAVMTPLAAVLCAACAVVALG
jgi:predicted permease